MEQLPALSPSEQRAPLSTPAPPTFAAIATVVVTAIATAAIATANVIATATAITAIATANVIVTATAAAASESFLSCY